MSLRGAKPMAGAVHDMGNSTTLSRYAGARTGRCQRMTKMQGSSRHKSK